MAAYLIPGVGFVKETGSGTYLLPGAGFVNETSGGGSTTIYSKGRVANQLGSPGGAAGSRGRIVNSGGLN